MMKKIILILAFVAVATLPLTSSYGDTQTDFEKWNQWSSENLKSYDDVISFLDMINYLLDIGIVQLATSDYQRGFEDGINSVVMTATTEPATTTEPTTTEPATTTEPTTTEPATTTEPLEEIYEEPIPVNGKYQIFIPKIDVDFETCSYSSDCYLPMVLEISVGSTVEFIPLSNGHTATSATMGKYVLEPDGIFDTGLLLKGNTFEIKFDESGIFEYFCKEHRFQTGIIIVD